MTITDIPAADEDRAGDDTPKVPTERERYIDGLRVLAAVLEKHPEVELPSDGTDIPLAINFWGADARERMAAAARAIPTSWEKKVSDKSDYFRLIGRLGGLQVELSSYRDAVCKRVVTGTREVTEKVKDPDKLAEVPEIEVKRVVEEVTWDCGSLLAPRPLAGEASEAIEAGAAA
jgi:hypothetical protein